MFQRLATFFMVLVPVFAFADIVKTPVHYRQGDTDLEGLLVYDNSITGQRPGVLVFPEWWGLNDYPKHRAEMLAQLGYVAFAADMYGNDQTTDSPDDAQKWMTAAKSDLGTLRRGPRRRWTFYRRIHTSIPAKSRQSGIALGEPWPWSWRRAGRRSRGWCHFTAGCRPTIRRMPRISRERY